MDTPQNGTDYPTQDRDALAHYLQELASLTPRQARKVAACFELRRTYQAEPIIVNSPKHAYRLLRDLSTLRKEYLVGLYLDAQNALICRETLSIGSLNTTRTHPREILLPAVANQALGFILAHNHPSGCLEPSEDDVTFTREVRRSSETMGIELYDSLVIARRGFTSLRARGVF